MMDLSFYTKQDNSFTLEVSEQFYEWLAKSNFTKISQSKNTFIINDGEKVELSLIELNEEVRARYKFFLLDSISNFSSKLIAELESKNSSILKANSPNHKNSLEAIILFIKTLQQLKEKITQEEYCFLEV